MVVFSRYDLVCKKCNFTIEDIVDIHSKSKRKLNALIRMVEGICPKCKSDEVYVYVVWVNKYVRLNMVCPVCGIITTSIDHVVEHVLFEGDTFCPFCKKIFGKFGIINHIIQNILYFCDDNHVRLLAYLKAYMAKCILNERSRTARRGSERIVSTYDMYCLWYWLINNKPVDPVEAIKQLGFVEVCKLGERWRCPICPNFTTTKIEVLGTHILKKHAWLWNTLEMYKLLPVEFASRCEMITSNPERFTKDDLLFEIAERPIQDSESLFGDDKFLEWYFRPVKNRR